MKRNTRVIEIIRQNAVETEAAKYVYKLKMMEYKKHFAVKVPRYCVEIEMCTSDGSITMAESGYIFVDVGKAIVFYEKLVEYLCTPLNLPYILEDSIC